MDSYWKTTHQIWTLRFGAAGLGLVPLGLAAGRLAAAGVSPYTYYLLILFLPLVGFCIFTSCFAKLRCPACGRRLVNEALIALFAVRRRVMQVCPRCGRCPRVRHEEISFFGFG